MRIALDSPWQERVRRLVSVDMPPKRLAPVLAFTRYIDAMIQVERARVHSKKQADAMLVDAVRVCGGGQGGGGGRSRLGAG